MGRDCVRINTPREQQHAINDTTTFPPLDAVNPSPHACITSTECKSAQGTSTRASWRLFTNEK